MRDVLKNVVSYNGKFHHNRHGGVAQLVRGAVVPYGNWLRLSAGKALPLLEFGFIFLLSEIVYR